MNSSAALLILGLAVAWPAMANDIVLLRDDFDGSSLDTSKWFVPTGPGTFFGRTQIRPPSAGLDISGGVIRLQLDTFNPTAVVAGDSFWGSEIDTIESFSVGSGLSFEARVRFASGIPGGLVGSLFSFVFLPSISGHDEIDFELLSNDVIASGERVLTNVFDDDDFSQPGDKSFANVAGLDLTAFHDYEIRWYVDRVEWFVDGDLIRTETDTVPDDPQNIRLNFWAPDAFFTEAYDAALVPADALESNDIYYYDVDFVEIRRLSESVPATRWVGWLALAGLMLLARTLLVRRRQLRVSAINPG
jgi:beta-glucanase (GH16 family)